MFNSTVLCPEQLAPTSDSVRSFPGFPQCGMRCGDLFFDANDQSQFNIVMLSLVISCILCNIFGMASLMLKLYTVRASPFNPDKCAMFMNISFLLSSLGYLLPLFPFMREASTCSEDGLRQFLTRGTNYLTFIFTLSGLVWFGHLMFACYLDFQKIINSHKKTKAVLFTLTNSSFVFFHGTAFLIPLIMAVAVIFLQSVEGNYVLGVCWIKPGHTAKTIFYLAQFTIILSIVLVFILLYWWNLRKARLGQFGTLKTQRNALRRLRFVGIMCMAIFLFHAVQLAAIWLRIDYDDNWNDALQKFLQCQVEPFVPSFLNQNHSDCSPILSSVKTSYLVAHYLMVISYFATGILISAWTWNLPNFRRWRFFANQITSNAPLSQNGSLLQDPLRGQDVQATNSPLINGMGSVKWNQELREMRHDAQRFQRPSIISGKKIASVADFDPERKLENWVEDARHIRITRRKSDAGNCCCSKASGSSRGLAHSNSKCIFSHAGHSDLHRQHSKPQDVKDSNDSGGFISF